MQGAEKRYRAAARHERDLPTGRGQPAARSLLASAMQQESATGAAHSWLGAASAAGASGAAAFLPQHMHPLAAPTDECSLGFLLRSLDEAPVPPSTTYQAAPGDSLLRGLSDGILSGECSLDAFAAGFAAGPVHVPVQGTKAAGAQQWSGPRSRLRNTAFQLQGMIRAQTILGTILWDV